MGARWLKAEFHSHCNLDPHDHRICDFSPEALVSEVARLGYEVLAVTCHDLDVWSRELAEYADSLGVTLIPGMEVLVEKRFHTLAYNFRTAAQNLDTFAKIRALRREDTLVIAPHPYFPARTCLGRRLVNHLDIFDAIELSGFYTRRLDFNRKARRAALEHGKPIVANADVHFLWQLSRSFTWVFAERGVQPVIEAVKQGRLKVETQPLSPADVSRWWAGVIWRALFGSKSAAGRVVPEPRSPVQGSKKNLITGSNITTDR